jgi:hypothetical protein
MGRITSCLLLALVASVASACTKKEAATEPERPAEKTAAEKPAEKAEKPPNFIVVLLDDTGYADFGAYGSEINTPNIDRLAANGLQFSTDRVKGKKQGPREFCVSLWIRGSRATCYA